MYRYRIVTKKSYRFLDTAHVTGQRNMLSVGHRKTETRSLKQSHKFYTLYLPIKKEIRPYQGQQTKAKYFSRIRVVTGSNT